jgi:hypothetical protein
VSFLKSVQTTPEGAAFLELLDDVTTAGLLQTLAVLLGSEDEDVSVAVVKLFEPRWTVWVRQLVEWSHATREEAPAAAAGWMSWFAAAKDETAGKVVTGTQASTTLRTLLQAALQTLGTRTGEARELWLLVLYQAMKADQTHLVVLDVESEVVKKGLRALVDLVDGPKSDATAVFNAVSILKLLTGLPNGRYNLANRLTEGYGSKVRISRNASSPLPVHERLVLTHQPQLAKHNTPTESVKPSPSPTPAPDMLTGAARVRVRAKEGST